MSVKNKKHKQTAWKKNRRFGDKMGGRRWLKLHDNIFKREHSFTAPSDLDETPIFMVDNTSRDYYFPIDTDDIKDVLNKYPEDKTEFITHIWLRKHIPHNPKHDTLASYIWGSRVYLVCLYPIRKDRTHYLGKKRPIGKTLHEYEKYAKIVEKKDGFYVQFNDETAKNYYLEILLPYCINGLNSCCYSYEKVQ